MADETRTVNLYNMHDGLTPRDGGPYLDQEQAREAEKRRALVENRDPDYDNPPAIAGTPLVTARQLVSTDAVHRPSQDHVQSPVASAIDDLVASDKFDVPVHSQAEFTDLSRKPEYNPADPTVVPTDGSTETTEETPEEESPSNDPFATPAS